MARKKRYFPRRRQRPSSEQAADPTIALDARHMAEDFTLERLEEIATQAQEAYDVADREAQADPGGPALQRYRFAARALAVAEQALDFAADKAPTG